MAILGALSDTERLAGLERSIGDDAMGAAAVADLRTWAAKLNSPQRAALGDAYGVLRQGKVKAPLLDVLFDGSWINEAETAVVIAPKGPWRAPAVELQAYRPPVNQLNPNEAADRVARKIEKNEPLALQAYTGEQISLRWSASQRTQAGYLVALVRSGDLIVYGGSAESDLRLEVSPSGALEAYDLFLRNLIHDSHAINNKVAKGVASFAHIRDMPMDQDLSAAWGALTALDRWFQVMKGHWWKQYGSPKFSAGVSNEVRRFISFVSASGVPVQPDFSFGTQVHGPLYYRTPANELIPVTGKFGDLIKKDGVLSLRRNLQSLGYVLEVPPFSPLSPYERELIELHAQALANQRHYAHGIAAADAHLAGSKIDLHKATLFMTVTDRDKVSREASWQREKEALLRKIPVANGRRFAESVLAAATTSSPNTSLSALIAQRFPNADALLSTLYPDQIAELRRLFPLHLMGVADFERSLFSDRDAVTQLIDNRRRWEDAGAFAPATQLSQVGFLVENDALPSAITFGEYVLSYVLDGGEGLASVSATHTSPAVLIPDRTSLEIKTQLKLRAVAFEKLLAANSRIQAILNSLDTAPTSAIRALFDEVRDMTVHYEELLALAGNSTEGRKARTQCEIIVAEVERNWMTYDENRPLPKRERSNLRQTQLAKSSLHTITNLNSLISYMYQGSFSAFTASDNGQWADAGTLVSARKIRFLDIGDEPLIDNRQLKSKPLAALLKVAKKTDQPQKDAVIVKDDEAMLQISGAEIYVKFAAPENGGMMGVYYHAGGETDRDPYPEGKRLRLTLIKTIMSRLGVAVDIQGDSNFMAVIDKHHALTSVSQLEELFPLTLQALDSLKDWDGALELLSRRATTRSIERETIPELADMIMAEGYLPATNMLHTLNGYYQLDQRSRREQLRHALNVELSHLGLPMILNDVPFGQATINRYFTRAIEDAIARGHLRRDGNGVPHPFP